MKEKIESGKTYLGIELGSTRIKASLIDDQYTPIASGSFEWENKLENGYWTYGISDIHHGIQSCFADLAKHVVEKYNIPLTTVGAMGISAMMHGYLAFDAEGNLLVPFRTWRNTTTEKAASALSELFQFNIPQRWSIAHLYQAILNNEPHVEKISRITTLAGYIHYLLTGRHEVGIGEASGMFPIRGKDYDDTMLAKFNALVEDRGYPWKIENILPAVQCAGNQSAYLSEAGAKFLDPSGTLMHKILVCPPEGDAGTGMVATNAVLPKTGNVSAGTSIFSMIVLEKNLAGMYPEIDMVTTPDGAPVAMVHCNNCCSEIDGWVKIFGEFASMIGASVPKPKLYDMLYQHAMTGDADCGQIAAYNYLSGEPVTGIEKGNPMYFRTPNSTMTLANFMRAQLYSTVSALKIGMDILFDKENVRIDKIQAHGGLFKTKGVAQQILSDALNTNVSVMETAGEGGAWGMALLSAYMMENQGKSLGDWLALSVFAGMKTETTAPEKNGVDGFLAYIAQYKAGLLAQKKLEEVR